MKKLLLTTAAVFTLTTGSIVLAADQQDCGLMPASACEMVRTIQVTPDTPNSLSVAKPVAQPELKVIQSHGFTEPVNPQLTVQPVALQPALGKEQ